VPNHSPKSVPYGDNLAARLGGARCGSPKPGHSKTHHRAKFRFAVICTLRQNLRVTLSFLPTALVRTATRRFSSRWQLRFANAALGFSAAIFRSVNYSRMGRLRAAPPNATSRVCAAPSKRCDAESQAASSSAVTPTAAGKRRC
jgi:hypothetical protein